MLFDTDVVIWTLRGNRRAAAAIEAQPERHLSAVSYMELLKGARDKREQRLVKRFLRDVGFVMLPIEAAICHRAVVYMEEYAVAAGLDLGDALIAATAAEHAVAVCTANDKHYRAIPDVELAVFRPA